MEQGQLLFRIDPAPFAAVARLANGRLRVEQARLKLAQQRHERVQALHQRGFASGSNRDEAEEEVASARASVDSARAELDRARLDLSFTSVRAPISGLTGMEAVSEGSLVDAGSQAASLLTTITQTNNFYVDFSVPEDEAGAIRSLAKSGPVRVELYAEDSSAPLASATVTFIDNRINETSNTVDMRASLTGNGRVSAGQFVQVRPIGLRQPEGLYVPTAAIGHGSEGPYLWTVAKDGTVAMRPIATATQSGDTTLVTRGLRNGERIVVEGGLKLQPGMSVASR